MTAGVSEVRSKLAGLSGSRASMLMVRQLMFAMVGGGVAHAQLGAENGVELYALWLNGVEVSSGEVAIGTACLRGAAASLHTACQAPNHVERLAMHRLSHKQGSALETDRYQTPRNTRSARRGDARRHKCDGSSTQRSG